MPGDYPSLLGMHWACAGNRRAANEDGLASGPKHGEMVDAPDTLTLGHLNLDVADLDRSERFYRDVFAFPVSRRSDSLLIRSAGFLIVLAAGRPASGGTFHFGFRVDADAAVDAWFVRFAALAVPIVEPPARRGAVYVGRVQDPDGYPIEVYAEHPDA